MILGVLFFDSFFWHSLFSYFLVSFFNHFCFPKWSRNLSKIDAGLLSHRGPRFTSFLHHFFPLLACKSDYCDCKNIDLLLSFIGYSGKCTFPLPVVFVLPLCPFLGSISLPKMTENRTRNAFGRALKYILFLGCFFYHF